MSLASSRIHNPGYMITTIVLLALLVIASALDWQFETINNWLVYPGILLGFAIHGVATALGVDAHSGTEEQIALWGSIGIVDSLTGFVACGLMMLVCFVFFAGQIGGGDVKLIAMLGAWLGLYAGFQAMLWTFVIGGFGALIQLVWKHGATKLATEAFQYGVQVLRLGGHATLSDEKRAPLQVPVRLAPSALIATIMVRWNLIDWF